VRGADTLSTSFAGTYFRGRTAIVTGASSGVGRDIALSFARFGVKVALLARRKPVLEELAHEIAAKTEQTPLVLAADVSDREQCHAAISHASDEFGHIDFLINSAGIMEPAPVESIQPAALQRMLGVNLIGTLNTMQAVIPAMRRARAGNIVNIASLAGRRGMPPLGGYCASKFAVVGLTEALRVELYGSGIKVSLVLPGVIDTPMVQGGAGIDALKGIPERFYSMPVQWVTWAVVAAIVFGLTEVDVPPGAAMAEKIAALAPGLTDGVIAFANRLMQWASRVTDSPSS
jgi:NAD(P)-dependent dehydrogenase (short-subunit alcohol dehydrogenase family)